MGRNYSRRRFLGVSTATALGLGTGAVAAEKSDDSDTKRAPMVDGAITRFATTARGAEVTGPLVLPNGNLTFSLQHPSSNNPAPFDAGGIGVVEGFDILGDDFDELVPPQTDGEAGRVRTAAGDYTIVAQGKDALGNGERLGVPTTPDGTNVDTFAGSRYEPFGFTPDMNQFVPTNADGTEGYLYTNWEASPGAITQLPLSFEDGSWDADLTNAQNLVNAAEFRAIGGTRINCYGDLSPWGTPLSAEEEYAHPRVTGAATVSDVVESGSGVGYRAASQFWNRPNPSEIQDAIGAIYGDDAWYVQGYWALGGVELLAYYLGAEPIDQSSDSNTTEPIADVYPNLYEYGYIVDIRDADSATPTPTKYYCMGRYAPESPDVMSDERTVFLTSDGEYKGLYKFVADEPIPSYDDPANVAGTLYAATVKNNTADKLPAQVPLIVEWLELGSATNGEVASWIAEYDGVTQQEYVDLGTADDNPYAVADDATLDAKLRAADTYVAEFGNPAYVSDEEIVEWAAQYEATGPDGVDEGLRKVPFLETRAAAKEIGATVEFRKGEGIDSRPDAEPGDYVYLGFSEINSGMGGDDEGDLQLERVDGGAVYRAKIQADYDLTKFDPVVVGPDGSDDPDEADHALVNVDNLRVMADGRVLLCEDADTWGRSYANDCLWVYDPDSGEGSAKSNGGSGSNA